ncbi:hypothetical protein ACFRAQ_35960 [Nocardia sp. NPDC056611]|uniref:hypothetical protein n=1 Tax=Nocardia sp. NPDC056611 TaxID=3345877 RepID=UPI003670109C
MTWKSIRRSIKGRMWILYMGAPGRGGAHWRRYLLPSFGDDEYYRKTLVLPLGVHALVIALWEFRNLRGCQCSPHCNPYTNDPLWARWKRIRTTYGRIER